MPKRNLRIVRRVRNVPVLGVCEFCNAQFLGDALSGNAQSVIQKQFNAHKCQVDVSPAPAPTAKEGIKGK